jgi:phosphoribosylglycinamide formyltransferase 1
VITLGVLVSGSGTNLQAILDATLARKLDAHVAVVVTNKAGVGAIERAARSGVPRVILDHKAYAGREAFDAAVVEVLRAHGVEWVVLAGFMRIVTRILLDAYPMRVINVHPALLPSFPGVDAQRQALEYGVCVTGCTVHFVDAGTDTGPVIAQRAVPVLSGDDVDSLRARILIEEHALLPEVLRWIAEGRVRVVPGVGGQRARVIVSAKETKGRGTDDA